MNTRRKRSLDFAFRGLAATGALGVVLAVAMDPTVRDALDVRAGKSPPSARVQLAPGAIKTLVEELAPGYALDPALVLAMISVESGYRTEAVSTADARGLMQLIPATAARFGVRDTFNPEQNLRGGMAYLKWLLQRFKGDVTLALAGYNAGEGAVDRYGGVPPYRETRRYVAKIRRLYDRREHPY